MASQPSDVSLKVASTYVAMVGAVGKSCLDTTTLVWYIPLIEPEYGADSGGHV